MSRADGCDEQEPALFIGSRMAGASERRRYSRVTSDAGKAPNEARQAEA